MRKIEFWVYVSPKSDNQQKHRTEIDFTPSLSGLTAFQVGKCNDFEANLKTSTYKNTGKSLDISSNLLLQCFKVWCQANVTYKGLLNKYFRLCEVIFVQTTQIFPGSIKAIVDNM